MRREGETEEFGVEIPTNSVSTSSSLSRLSSEEGENEEEEPSSKDLFENRGDFLFHVDVLLDFFEHSALELQQRLSFALNGKPDEKSGSNEEDPLDPHRLDILLRALLAFRYPEMKRTIASPSPKENDMHSTSSISPVEQPSKESQSSGLNHTIDAIEQDSIPERKQSTIVRSETNEKLGKREMAVELENRTLRAELRRATELLHSTMNLAGETGYSPSPLSSSQSVSSALSHLLTNQGTQTDNQPDDLLQSSSSSSKPPASIISGELVEQLEELESQVTRLRAVCETQERMLADCRARNRRLEGEITRLQSSLNETSSMLSQQTNSMSFKNESTSTYSRPDLNSSWTYQESDMSAHSIADYSMTDSMRTDFLSGWEEGKDSVFGDDDFLEDQLTSSISQTSSLSRTSSSSSLDFFTSVPERPRRRSIGTDTPVFDEIKVMSDKMIEACEVFEVVRQHVEVQTELWEDYEEEPEYVPYVPEEEIEIAAPNDPNVELDRIRSEKTMTISPQPLNSTSLSRLPSAARTNSPRRARIHRNSESSSALVEASPSLPSVSESDLVEQMRQSYDPWIEPAKCIESMQIGRIVVKYCRNAKPHSRFFRLSPDRKRITWYPLDALKNPYLKGKERSLLLADVRGFVLGPFSDVFCQALCKKSRKIITPENFESFYLCLSLHFDRENRSLDLCFDRKSEWEFFVDGFRFLLHREPVWGCSIEITLPPRSRDIRDQDKMFFEREHIKPIHFTSIRQRFRQALRNGVAVTLDDIIALRIVDRIRSRRVYEYLLETTIEC